MSKPNVARVYDFVLGGKDNFAADRALAQEILRVAPKAPMFVRANRELLRRVVRFLASEAGLTQFLDIGSGLPRAGNVSEVVHAVNPGAHVVYVDNDPVACAHSAALLGDAATTGIVMADVRKPASILADPVVNRHIDFSRPVGLLLFAILHHVDDADDPAAIMATLRNAMAPGSYLAISSFRMPGPEHPELRAAAAEGEQLLTGQLGSGRWRETQEIASWFGDWEMLPPGLVSMTQWRPDPGFPPDLDDVYESSAAGVARKPAGRRRPRAPGAGPAPRELAKGPDYDGRAGQGPGRTR